jgi:hypothetical protein
MYKQSVMRRLFELAPRGYLKTIVGEHSWTKNT